MVIHWGAFSYRFPIMISGHGISLHSLDNALKQKKYQLALEICKKLRQIASYKKEEYEQRIRHEKLSPGLKRMYERKIDQYETCINLLDQIYGRLRSHGWTVDLDEPEKSYNYERLPDGSERRKYKDGTEVIIKDDEVVVISEGENFSEIQKQIISEKKRQVEFVKSLEEKIEELYDYLRERETEKRPIREPEKEDKNTMYMMIALVGVIALLFLLKR